MLATRKLALVGIIPNQILFSERELHDSRIRQLRCVFSSDPAVSSSLFVGAAREGNLNACHCFTHVEFDPGMVGKGAQVCHMTSLGK